MEFRKITAKDLSPLKDVDLLFYQPAYLQTQNYEDLIAYAVFDPSKLVAVIVFNHKNGVATSLQRSIFGSIYSRIPISQPLLQDFLGFIKAALKEIGVQQIEVTLPPPIYHDFETNFWSTQGFRTLKEETNQHLSIDGNFNTGLHQMELRKLKKLHSGNIRFGMEPTSMDVLIECHAFIERCRKDQGLTVNIDLKKLKELAFSLEGRYQVFTARSGNNLVATVITCLVDQDHLYYYLPATDQRYRKESPMVGLVESIYKYCVHRGIKYLDLGVSSKDGVLQQGLYDFKRRLGAQESIKPTLYLAW